MAGLTTRSSIESLEADSSGLDALRDAYGKMQKLLDSDNRSWIYWAGIHGYNQFKCWHHYLMGSDQFPYNLFLPWHRAYLLYFEHTARDQNDGVALPWWDWTSPGAHQTGIPQSFSVREINAQPNALASGPMPELPAMPPFPAEGARPTRRQPRNPRLLPTADDVQNLMSLGSFVDFTDQLEEIHDSVHGWVRGDMGVVAKAAFDPIFWSHHCMIDRIWYLWQLQNGVNTIPDEYLDKPLAPFALTVRDVLDINSLGYEYAQSAVTVDA